MYRSTIPDGFFKLSLSGCSTENDNNKRKKQYQLGEYMVESSVLQYKKCDAK